MLIRRNLPYVFLLVSGTVPKDVAVSYNLAYNHE